MEDIRRPYRGQRRDYALPANRQPNINSTDLRPPTPAQPAHQPQHHSHPAAHHAATTAQPAYHPPAYHPQPHHHQPQPHAQYPVPHHTRQRRLSLSLSWPVIAAIILALIALVGGFMLLKPKTKPTVTPTQLAAQASFSFYYPAPPPTGYVYDKQISTFENGQAYYLLANGKKHIIVHEQAANTNQLDLSILATPKTFTTSSGQAAVGVTAGEASGILLTSSTLVDLNSTGSVPQSDIEAVINNLRILQK